jgi:hypothetical protein
VRGRNAAGKKGKHIVARRAVKGHPIIPLSRKKLFKEKSIDRKPAFFG